MGKPDVATNRPASKDNRATPHINGVVLRLFRRVVRSYFRRHFRSVMVQNAEGVRGLRGPLIVYGNHSSWWDPMISILLAAELLPNEHHYAPIDARALASYPILGKLGLFPVELDSPRGAIHFLRTAEAILAGGGVLWMTPQGRFVDPREQPPVFRPGLGALALRVPDVPLIPLAVEYTFWDERLPEALGRFGPPLAVSGAESSAMATSMLEEALAVEMSTLATASRARDADAFSPVLTGTRGSGGVYGLARRLRSWFSGRRFQPDHTERSAGQAGRHGRMQQ